MSTTTKKKGSMGSGLAAAVLIAMAVGLAGCGKNGSDGAAGAAGAPGAPGTPAAPTPIRTDLGPAEDLPGLAINIVGVTGATGAGGSFAVGDKIAVNFTVKTKPKTAQPATPISLAELDWLTILVSGPSFNYQRVIPQQFDVTSKSVQQADGSWTYTFASGIPSSYAAPLNNPGAVADNAGVLAGTALLQGTYTVGMEAFKVYTVGNKSFRDAGNGTFDVRFGGASTIDTREVAKLDDCNKCHTELRAHGDIRRQLSYCILCHTAGALDKGADIAATPQSISFKVMIHKIHNGGHLPSVNGIGAKADGTRDYTVAPTPYQIIGYGDGVNDFSEVNFPVWPSLNIAMPRNLGFSLLSSTQRTQDNNVRFGVVECSKCHGGALHEEVAYQQPSRAACGACHDDIDFTKNYIHNVPPNGMPMQLNDATCNQCHAKGGGATRDPLSIIDAHKHPLTDPSINRNIAFGPVSVTGGTDTGGNFKAGDSPKVTFTLKDSSGNNVNPSDIDGATMVLSGPTWNYQPVTPLTAQNGIQSSPFDTSGRFVTAKTSGAANGNMSKVFPAGPSASNEVVTVTFTSNVAFNILGSVNGLLGSSALPTATSIVPSGAGISAIVLGPSAVAQTFQVAFADGLNFSVTGSVSGAMGTGKLPATTNATVRWVSNDKTVAFIVTVGSTAFTGTSVFNGVIAVAGVAADPVAFMIVAGANAFVASDRFYFEYWAPASTYALNLPMDLTTEYLGEGSGAPGQVFTPANLPVYFGRQSLYERTATATAYPLAAAASAGSLYIDVTGSFSIGSLKFVVLDDATPAVKEFLVPTYTQALVAGQTRVWFKIPLRFAHATSATLSGVTLALRLEGVDYTLDSTAGTITSLGAGFGARSIVMSYRSYGRFGWKRYTGDTFQTTVPDAINDSLAIDETSGKWAGKPLVPGTYTIALWGQVNIDLALNGEVQTYRGTSLPLKSSILYGGATEIQPYDLISWNESQQKFAEAVGTTCNNCHNDEYFHGGGRRSFETCIMCHGTSGMTLSNDPSTPAPEGANFRWMLHKIHRGSDLAKPGNWAGIEFPTTPGGVAQCVACHGATSTSWKDPTDRSHPTAQTKGIRRYYYVCGSCHDSDSEHAHMQLNTTTNASGQTFEACTACHGPNADLSVETVHKQR
jgi:hypothetical protein